jgi:hypothetical protein
VLRLAYLALTNTFALIRLLPMSDRDKDVEILALRHQLAVLQRKAGKPAFTPNDRTLLARAPAPPPHPEATAAPPADASAHYPALT